MKGYTELPVRDGLISIDLLRLHVCDSDTFAFDLDNAEAVIKTYDDLADAATKLVKALEALTNAKAISGVRGLVAGWNGEGRDEPYKERHPHRLGATLPKTCCGDVYALDDAMPQARSALNHYRELAGTSNEGVK